MRSHALAALLCLGLAVPAEGQGDGDAIQRVEKRMRELDATWRLGAPVDAAISERMLLDWGASATTAVYRIDDAEREDHVLRQYDGRIYLRAEADGHRFFGRLQYRYDDWNTNDDFDGRGDGRRVAIGERWWYEFDLRSALQARSGERSTYDVNLKLGKQFVEWGNGVALSSVLIGALAEVEWNGLALDLLVADTPSSDTVDFDASRPRFDRDTKRRFFGAELEWRRTDGALFVHALRQLDYNTANSTTFVDGNGVLYPTRFNYDSSYFGLGWRGSIVNDSSHSLLKDLVDQLGGSDLSLHWEACLETGRALSSPISASGTQTAQTSEDIRAWAFAAGVSSPLRYDPRSRVDADLIIGSGDDDRLDSADTFGGNLTGTTDRAFNGFGYFNTGLALAPDPSNLVIAHVGNTGPIGRGCGELVDRLRAIVDGFVFVKIDPDAPINLPTTDDRLVGGEVDAGFDWSLWSDVTVQLRYGIFIPGPAMPAGQDGTRQIIFGGVTYAF